MNDRMRVTIPLYDTTSAIRSQSWEDFAQFVAELSRQQVGFAVKVDHDHTEAVVILDGSH